MTDQVGHIVDLMPTFLDLAKADYPDIYQGQRILPVEGISLAQTLTAGKTFNRPPLGWEWSRSRASEIGDDKLVWGKSTKKWELYDLAKDPSESRDLAKNEPEKVNRCPMTGLLGPRRLF